MVLVNGAEGVGTGFSCSVPTYDPLEIIANLRRQVRGEALQAMSPSFARFRGQVVADGEGGFTIRGVARAIDETTVEISELPLFRWTQDYKDFLASLLQSAEQSRHPFQIRGFTEHHGTDSVRFVVRLSAENLRKAKSLGLHQAFRLENSWSLRNMHLFTRKGDIVRFEDPLQVIRSYADVRLEFYHRRKAHLITVARGELEALSRRLALVELVVRGAVTVVGATRAAVEAQLEAAGVGRDAYEQLSHMPLASLTVERVERLQREVAEKQQLIARLEQQTPQDMWLADLDELERFLQSRPPRHPDGPADSAAGAATRGSKRSKRAAR
jgi:DNA topoisomerase-2